MILSDVIDKCQLQLRLTPLVSDTDVTTWLRQAIRDVCVASLVRDTWTIIVGKADVAKYALPTDHIVSVGAYYNNVRLQRATAYDAQLVSANGPVYYYEDEWSDDASDAVAGEFALQIALVPLWPFQLVRMQNTFGRKTMTLVDAPTVDGDTPPLGIAPTGTLDGTFDAGTVLWLNLYGIPMYAASSDNNLLLLYKAVDTLPEASTDTMSWNDPLAVLYAAQAISLALGTEDDEYDRYRSWLYGYVVQNAAKAIRNMTINVRMR